MSITQKGLFISINCKTWLLNIERDQCKFALDFDKQAMVLPRGRLPCITDGESPPGGIANALCTYIVGLFIYDSKKYGKNSLKTFLRLSPGKKLRTFFIRPNCFLKKSVREKPNMLALNKMKCIVNIRFRAHSSASFQIWELNKKETESNSKMSIFKFVIYEFKSISVILKVVIKKVWKSKTRTKTFSLKRNHINYIETETNRILDWI